MHWLSHNGNTELKWNMLLFSNVPVPYTLHLLDVYSLCCNNLTLSFIKRIQKIHINHMT